MDFEVQLFAEKPANPSPNTEVFAVTMIDGCPPFPDVDLPLCQMDDDWEFPDDVTDRVVLCAAKYKQGWAWVPMTSEAKRYVGNVMDKWRTDGQYELGQWCFMTQRTKTEETEQPPAEEEE